MKQEYEHPRTIVSVFERPCPTCMIMQHFSVFDYGKGEIFGCCPNGHTSGSNTKTYPEHKGLPLWDEIHKEISS